MVLVTWLLASMDFQPIHYAWWHNGQWPTWAGAGFVQWSEFRKWTGLILCPPCAAFAENYYFSLMEVEAGAEEQTAILRAPYSGNPFAPDGPRYWWGQGEGRPWRPVSMAAFYLYWLPPSVLWWVMVGDLFAGRQTWWLRYLLRLRVSSLFHRNGLKSSKEQQHPDAIRLASS